jgi:hypothetical protein
MRILLVEISVVPAPANPDTRFLSLKAVETSRATNEDSLRAKYQDFVKRMGSEPVAREILGLSERVSRQILGLPTINASDASRVTDVGGVKSYARRELRFATFDVAVPGEFTHEQRGAAVSGLLTTVPDRVSGATKPPSVRRRRRLLHACQRQAASTE